MAKTVVIDGLEELLAQLDGLKSDGIAGDVADAVETAVKSTAETIRSEAPLGATGNLRRSITSGVYKKSEGKPIAGFVTVDYGIGPHAHLVEFGARGGDMPRNPFFSRGWRKSRGPAESIVVDGVKSAIEKAL